MLIHPLYSGGGSGGGGASTINELEDGYTRGVDNLGLGKDALKNNRLGTPNVGEKNTAVGFNALYNNYNGYRNLAVGANSMLENTSGRDNVALGEDSLRNNTTGFNNTGIGRRALGNITTGYRNVAIGDSAMFFSTTGFSNISLGRSNLTYCSSGGNNISLGESAMFFGTGSYNTALGNRALYNNRTDHNIGIGYRALYANKYGNNNIAIGERALEDSVSDSNQLYINGWIVGDNGAITLPQQPSLLAKTNNYSKPAGWQLIILDTIDYDTNDDYNELTGIFTAPADGNYMFSWGGKSTYASTTDEQYSVSVNINSIRDLESGGTFSAVSSPLESGSIVRKMLANDTATLNMHSDNAITLESMYFGCNLLN